MLPCVSHKSYLEIKNPDGAVLNFTERAVTKGGGRSCRLVFSKRSGWGGLGGPGWTFSRLCMRIFMCTPGLWRFVCVSACVWGVGAQCVRNSPFLLSGNTRRISAREKDLISERTQAVLFTSNCSSEHGQGKSQWAPRNTSLQKKKSHAQTTAGPATRVWRSATLS